MDSICRCALLLTWWFLLLSPRQVAGQEPVPQPAKQTPTLIPQLGHFFGIRAVALSSDGKWLVTAGKDKANKDDKNPQEKKSEEKELARIDARFKDEKIGKVLNGLSWTLGHCATEDGKAKVFAALGHTEEDGPLPLKAAIERAGGVEAYRRRITSLLTNDDVIARGFGALWLGALGDPQSAPDLLKLLRDSKLPVRNFDGIEAFKGFDRSRAAIGLGLLGAKEHAAELAKLLESENETIRGGAAYSLGYMKTTKYAPNVAKAIPGGSETAAVWALLEMDARDQASEIVAYLKSNQFSDPAVGLYALVKFKATEYAKDVATLLKGHRKGEAAKVLALWNAQDYKGAIADLLKDEYEYARRDGLLALGMLRAVEHEDRVAKLLEDRHDFVRGAAGWALVMMESKKHSKKALAAANAYPLSYLLPGLSPSQIAKEEFQKVCERAESTYRKMRAAESGK